MEEIVSKQLCTGCTSCMNICPKKAIHMEEYNDGFKYLVIDQGKCINCELCKKTCPVLNTKANESLNKCYVGYNKDVKERLSSSSGSIFSLVANYILDNKGIVIGAAFDKDNKLKHIAINKKEELDKLKGSKYLQSDLENVFTYIKDNIVNKKMLFVGTPCQVSGLKAFLKKDYDNLICIDLFCHGVPSPKLFNKYIKELETKYDDKLENFNFRDNTSGWSSYSYTANFKNNTFTELSGNNSYSKLFLSDIALRESCYNCNFKLGNKYSDITLGDFWGVKDKYPEMYNKEGVSAIIVNTNKGLDIFNSINKDMEYKECNIGDILSGNPSLKKSGIKPSKRDMFFNDINSLSTNELVKKYVPKRSIIKKINNKVKRTLQIMLKKDKNNL